MDSDNPNPITTNISSPRASETTSAMPTAPSSLELSPEAVELLHTRTLLREVEGRYQRLCQFTHTAMQNRLQEMHTIQHQYEAEIAERLNVERQFNRWRESAREAFAEERAALANAEHTIENLREQLEDCTCKCECPKHADQAGCVHAENLKVLQAKLEEINCCVCLNTQSDALFPCGHVPCCMACAHQLSASNSLAEGVARCPTCRVEGQFQKIYFA